MANHKKSQKKGAAKKAQAVAVIAAKSSSVSFPPVTEIPPITKPDNSGPDSLDLPQ